MSGPPTQQQIAIVQQNLKSIQAFNDYVYNYGNSKVLNAYLLLNQPSNSDPGLNIGLNVLEGIFWGVGSEFGPVGNFLASFVSGMVSAWSTSAPPNLQTTFSNVLNRINATSQAIDSQLAVFHDDVAGHWNTSFTYNGQTQALSALADMTFPIETDESFFPLAKAALLAMDQSIWKEVLLANFSIISWPPAQIWGDADPAWMTTWTDGFIAANPSYTVYGQWIAGSGCGSYTGWMASEENISIGATSTSDGAISNAACQYLFIDSTPGVVINSDGLFTRQTVFELLGLSHGSSALAMSDTLSVGYLRAAKKGKTISALLQREGRDALQQRVIEAAKRDRIFAHNLAARPTQTLEKFLGVRIPETVSVRVVLEGPNTFGLVVPGPEGAARK